MRDLELFVTGHRGFENPLYHELRRILPGDSARLTRVYGGCEIAAGLESAYRICLYSRLANRVYCTLASGAADDEQALYRTVHDIPWEDHFEPGHSFAVSATLARSRFDNSHFVALKTKDAIVDRFRDRTGERPSVERQRPDIRVHVHVMANRVQVSLDLGGDSLHRRGYRLRHGGAPLKEHLAAAILVQAGWMQAEDGPRRLVDPLCGSGTFAIEAAMMAANLPPGLGRDYFGFSAWSRHDAELWSRLEAQARAGIRSEVSTPVLASDRDGEVLAIARENAARAGVEGLIEFARRPLDRLELPPIDGVTLVVCNPPYGQRLDAEAGLGRLYDELGEAVGRLAPARLAVISANPSLLHRLRLSRISRKDVRNGPLQCLLGIFATADGAAAAASAAPVVAKPAPAVSDPSLRALCNRLQKNAKHLRRWARRNDVSCYRLYDADLPEYAFALDLYQSEVDPGVTWFHLQEYQAPPTIDPDTAERRLGDAAASVVEQFEIPADRLFIKTRSRQRGKRQYQRQAGKNEFFQVREGPASLLVNLSDYLDTGLFLDHRALRRKVYEMARGRRVLNLFCYTASLGVFAGLGGADSVLNVDLSNTYLDWARENHRLNGLDDESRFAFLRADVVELLRHPRRFPLQSGYDMICFDPPSFSNSKKMRNTLDIQRDHGELLRQAMALLAADGLLIFSTNRRGFRLDETLAEAFAIEDFTRASIDEDFRRRPGIHRCWFLRHSRC